MTKAVQGNQIDKLIEQFGSTLDGTEFQSGLTRYEKISLRTVLGVWVSLRQSRREIPLADARTLIEDAWEASCISQYMMCTEDTQKALQILDGITVEQGNELIRALSEQLTSTK